MLRCLGLKTLASYQWEYINYKKGLVEYFSLEAWQGWIANDKSALLAWPVYKNRIGRPDFIKFMDENVLK